MVWMSVMSLLLRCHRLIRREATIEDRPREIDYLAGYGSESRIPFRRNRTGLLAFCFDAWRQPDPSQALERAGYINRPDEPVTNMRALLRRDHHDLDAVFRPHEVDF